MPKGIYPRQSAVQRFWSRVDKNGPIHPVLKTRCWIWTGQSNAPGGYGRFCSDTQKFHLTHRYSYLIHLSDPGRLCVCHHCDNPICVNPEHLFLGTNADNALDRDLKGRQVIRRGEEFTHSKLTDDAVQEIRKRYIPFHPVHGVRPMSREFGVSHTVIKWVIRRKIWKHVD